MNQNKDNPKLSHQTLVVNLKSQDGKVSSVYELPISEKNVPLCQNKSALKIENVPVLHYGERKNYSLVLCLKQKSVGDDIYPFTFIKQVQNLSMALFGKVNSNFILLFFAVASYFVGLLISLISLLIMDLIFRFNPERGKECVFPMCFIKDEDKEDLTIELDRVNPNENVVYSGSELFYNLGNFIFAIVLSIVFASILSIFNRKFSDILFIFLLICLFCLLILIFEIFKMCKEYMKVSLLKKKEKSFVKFILFASLSLVMLVMLGLFISNFGILLFLLLLLLFITSIILRIYANCLLRKSQYKSQKESEGIKERKLVKKLAQNDMEE